MKKIKKMIERQKYIPELLQEIVDELKKLNKSYEKNNKKEKEKIEKR